MGATNEARSTKGPLTLPELRSWYEDMLEEMAREGGTDGYCGNWNCNAGLRVIEGSFTQATAEAHANRHLSKRGEVYAYRIGDFGKAWPVTKAQRELLERETKLVTEENEFEYRILERAQLQKSKTKKCLHCESNINVHKIQKPALRDLKREGYSGRGDMGVSFRFGRYIIASFYGLTDCPVCFKNLLKTETDKKNQASLLKRLTEAREKVIASRKAYAAEQVGKPVPYWYVEGLCAC